MLSTRCSSQIVSDAPAGSAAVSRALAGPGANCCLRLYSQGAAEAEGAGPPGELVRRGQARHEGRGLVCSAMPEPLAGGNGKSLK